VGEGVPGWYGPLGTQVGAFPSFTETRRFERKRTKITFQAASHFFAHGRRSAGYLSACGHAQSGMGSI
jgi:hypothetical protein